MQVYLPGAGWMEFDPTNGIVGNRDLIRVAVARDPRQAVPLHGTWTGLPADNLGMDVEVEVTVDSRQRRNRPRCVAYSPQGCATAQEGQRRCASRAGYEITYRLPAAHARCC